MTSMHQRVRTTSGRQVLRATSAIKQFTPQLTRALERNVSEDGWDVSAACVEELQRSLGRVLESRLGRLRETIDVRRRAAQDGRRVRAQRDEASRDVYRLLVRLRHLVLGMGGSDAERALFGPGKTPREPKQVAATARELRFRMTSEGARGELAARFGGIAVLDAWIDELAEPLDRLTRALDQVQLLELDESTAVQQVRRSREDMRRAKKNVLKLLEGLYGLAELEELGQKLRYREVTARQAEETTTVHFTPEVEASEERRTVSHAPPAVEREPERLPTARVAGSPEIFAPEPAATVSSTHLAPRRGVKEAEPRGARPFHLERTRKEGSPSSTHPVRKVLRWLSGAPHRVETGDSQGVPAATREEAA